MQAIRTKYLGPTNFHGARLSAVCYAKRIVIPWDHALNAPENHAAAARDLATRLQWLDGFQLVSGCLHDGTYAHVLTVKP